MWRLLNEFLLVVGSAASTLRHIFVRGDRVKAINLDLPPKPLAYRRSSNLLSIPPLEVRREFRSWAWCFNSTPNQLNPTSPNPTRPTRFLLVGREL